MSNSKQFPSHALAEFFKGHDEVKAKEDAKTRKKNATIEEKRRTMAPMNALLKSLVTIGVRLQDGRMFQFYERESSPSWSPGFSLCFDHPVPIEIAIPNDPVKEGAVVIRVAAEDKEAYLLEKKFESLNLGMDALAAYLGRHTVMMEIDIRQKNVKQASHKIHQKDIEQRDEGNLSQDTAV